MEAAEDRDRADELARGFQRVRPDQLRSVARLLAAALDDDPAYAYLMPDPARRADGLADFFAGHLKSHLAAGCTHLATDATGQPIATVTLRPPGGIQLAPRQLVPALARFGFRYGLDALKRLRWLARTYDELELAAAGGQAHRYVHMMAVRADRQGRGLGGRLLAGVLGAASSTGPSVPAVLTTHRERNVVFYRRAGFEVTDERTLHPPAGTPYVVWSMARR
jgi:GNAT superfamily N-acetyltransferase